MACGSVDKHVAAPTLRVPVRRLQNPARLPTTLCSRSNSLQAFPSPVRAAQSLGPAGVVPRRRRLGKRPPPGPSWPQPPALCQLTQTRVGLFQAEPNRLQRAEFVQSQIDALKALVEHSAEQIPGPCRLTRAALGQHPNTGLQPNGIGHCGTLSLPLQHQTVAGWTSAKLRGRSAAAAHADRRVVAFDPVLNIQDANVPLPHIQGVADVEELFLSVQLELVQRFRPRLPPKAVELLTVHTNDVAQITVPPEDNAEHVVEFGERHVIGDRDQADDHRAHLAQNRSQNQAFEGDCFSHLSRLLDRPTPDFLALSSQSVYEIRRSWICRRL